MAGRVKLKNTARGNGSYHQHRFQIVRAVLDRTLDAEPLSTFLRDRLFRLEPARWSVFQFVQRDWELCDRLLAIGSVAVESAMLDLAANYISANSASMQRLIELDARMSGRLLDRDLDALAEEDPIPAVDVQSLFGLRLQCAASQRSTDAMGAALRQVLAPGWAKSRLAYPLMYHFAGNPATHQLDSFLSYILTGEEADSERLALKLMLNSESARDASLAFKIYIGMMGHPFDVLEIVLDQFEHELSSERRPPSHLLAFVQKMSEVVPVGRASALSRLAAGKLAFCEGPEASRLCELTSTDKDTARHYASLVAVNTTIPVVPDATRPFAVLGNMRALPYPSSAEFQFIVADAATWFFTSAGRLLISLLRSLYMIDRDDRRTEARDALRLLLYFGSVTPLIAAAPSAMLLLRRLSARGIVLADDADSIEASVDQALQAAGERTDRLWISLLQWRLRKLEEQGRIEQWLRHVREETKLRPSYLTGINWEWVDEVLTLQRLRPFRSFDGAYLFIHMEMERNSDPLRLRLVLDPLLRDFDFDAMVARIVEEFGTSAPAIVRRYLTTQNMLASGQAPNYVAALDQRVRALEQCIRASGGFGPLLTEEMYEGEVRTLTAELLLNDVNAGKFEVPWETFRKDALALHEDLMRAVDTVRSRVEQEGQLTELIETPVVWPNGATQRYKLRQRDRARFSLVFELLGSYMQHPAFGLEVILSARFRHNNLLQELWSAIADTNSARIPSVPPAVQRDLIEEYRRAAEVFADEWCSDRLQSRRAEKPNGLFNLIPDQREMEQLLDLASETAATDVVDLIVDWLRVKLRSQVAEAQTAFATSFKSGIERVFEGVKDKSAVDAGATYRLQDVARVHSAVSEAVARKVDELRSWFSGVDDQPTGSISLAELGVAAETLFENMIEGRSIKGAMDADAENVLFETGDVKIAFDLLREIYFNALRHGRGPAVEMTVRRVIGTDVVYSFENASEPVDAPVEQVVEGHRYLAASEAITREGNSGRLKIAASAATLIGRDTTVLCSRSDGTYSVKVPLRPGGAPR